MISYEVAKRLKDAGFTQPLVGAKGDYRSPHSVPEDVVYLPTLTELLAACGKFESLERCDDDSERVWWCAWGVLGTLGGIEHHEQYGNGVTPEDAVAELWIAVQYD
jgi:hypothetical protein